MCKYCKERESIDNVSNCPTNMFIEKHWWTENDTFFLNIVNDVNLGVGGNFYIVTSTKIDYCPFCGKELKK